MSSTMQSPDQMTLEQILNIYLLNIERGGRDGTSEMEIRFGTARGMKPISRIEYDNVVKRLLSAGFELGQQNYLLRMNSEFTDPKSGVTRVSNIRAEIAGIGNVSEYCKSNDLDEMYSSRKVMFIQKGLQRLQDGVVRPVDVPDFNMRASLSLEKDLTNTQLVKSMVSSWRDNKKQFRYINRYKLTHRDIPIAVDVSIVKQSARQGRNLALTYTFQEAELDKQPERYEVELEVDNFKVGIGTQYSTPEQLLIAVKKVVKLVLAGLQGTNYPVSYPEQYMVLASYMQLLWGDKYREGQRVYPKNFVGPSSVSLQIKNIAPINEDANIPNIRNGYTVTEKADGERKLLYITDTGKLYLIDTNMNVQFTGAKTLRSELFNSLLDGEHILHNKEKKFINLYAAFDIYYKNGEDLREKAFMSTESTDEVMQFRLPILASVMKELNAVYIADVNVQSPLNIEAKTFYAATESQSIFQACAYLLARVRSGVFDYETDGLIFTPSLLGVGGNMPGETTTPRKITWEHSFKWKPPEFNTIDFMVTMQRGTDGREEIKNVFQGGLDMSAANQVTQYKTAILRVGFDEEKHGYTNPCKNVIDDDLPNVDDKDDETGYRPMQFFPTNPVDDNAGICNLMLETDFGDNKAAFTENREVIEDNQIVEFRYNIDKESGWRWEPLRVRYDKTADLRSGGKNYGNAYHVANSNWHSIHNPVTEAMISSGFGIPDELGDDDVYYNRNSKSSTVTRSLRDFHNLFVKKKLITSVSKRGGSLIDYAVGMGGDFSKWISAKLGFVFGVDISRDNIDNRLKGACARYLNYRKQFKRMPSALFVAGNSSVNIRDLDAIFTDKGKQITNAVFGKGPKDAVELGKGVYKHYGIGQNGFDVGSIQFAVHYMFENPDTFNGFIRNASETIKVGGYICGTCYDGTKVFKMLQGKKVDESVTLMDGDIKMWEITKRYDRASFPATVASLGYAIDVFQESIGKTFREYLVNFEYLDRVMTNYGFARLTADEAKDLGLPASRGSFRELFGDLQEEVKRRPSSKNEYGAALNLSDAEKTISFLNNYFVYKKTHDVDARAVANSQQGVTLDEHLAEQEEAEQAAIAVNKVLTAQAKSTKKPKKLKRKVKLVTTSKDD